MKHWDGEILGPERFHVFEGLRRRYGPSLKASCQRLDAWCQENCRLPRLRRNHGGSSETARDEDCHALVLKGLRVRDPNSLNAAEIELLERLRRQANTDAWQANIREVERQTRERQKAAGWMGAQLGVENNGAKFGVEGAKFGVMGAPFGIWSADCGLNAPFGVWGPDWYECNISYF